MRAIALACFGVGWLLTSTVGWDQTAVARWSELVGGFAEADEVSSSIASAQQQSKPPSNPPGKPPSPCSVNNGGCSQNASCTSKGNSQNSVMCTCQSGYTGNGITCSDINECLSNNGGCNADATCTNLPGGRTCGCNAGYSGDGVTCTNINECASNTDNCDVNAASCTDTPGSFTCACTSGFTGDGVSCNDINECLVNNGACDANATCTNIVGAPRTCACIAGFTGNGFTCTPTGGPDVTLPVLTLVDVPGSAGEGQTLTVSAIGEDDQSGVQSISVGLTWSIEFGPNGDYPDAHFIASCSSSASPPYPLTLPGTCNLNIPMDAIPGQLSVWAKVVDGAGNIRRYAPGGTVFFPADTILDNTIAPNLYVQVSSDGDSVDPVMLSITGVPATVDVTDNAPPNFPEVATINLQAFDAGSQIIDIRLRWIPVGSFQNPNPILFHPNSIGDCYLSRPFGFDPPVDPQTLTGTCQVIFEYASVDGDYDLVAWVRDWQGRTKFYDVGQLTMANRTQTHVQSNTLP